MKIKVSEATGSVLDWMVAICEGGTDVTHISPTWTAVTMPADDAGGTYEAALSELGYTTNWALGGPIISRERISVRHWTNVPVVHAYMPDSDWSSDGESALVAAMRCYVINKLGGEVEVPGELQNG